MTSENVDIHSAVQAVTYLTESLTEISALAALPLDLDVEGTEFAITDPIVIMSREDVDAAFEAREQALPFSREQAIKTLWARLEALHAAAESIEFLTSDLSQYLGGPALDED